MDLNLTAEELRFRDELRAWLEANVPEDWEQVREEALQARFAFLRSWQRKLYDAGWGGVSWPKEYGGRGASLMQQVIFWLEMPRVATPPMANALALAFVRPPMIQFG